MGTYILYIGTILLCLILTKVAKRRESSSPLIAVVIILSIIAGFRGPNVGIDTANYIEKFELIKNEHFLLAYGLEEGFKYLVFFLLKLFNNYNVIFLIFALITNILIMKRLWDFKDEIDITYAFCIYYVSFFFMTMNVMRQFCAIAIIFYYSRLIEKNKYILFSIIVCVTAIFIHQSAAIGFLYIVLEIIQWKYLTKKSKRLLISGSVSIPAIYFVIAEKILKYQHYFSNAEVKMGYMLPLKLCAALFFLLLINNFKIKIYKRKLLSMEKIKERYKEISVNNYYILGLIISMFGYFYPFMDRIGWYFYIYECVFYGKLVKNRKYGNLIKIIVMIFSMYIFVTNLASKAQGVIPYNFFWNM